MTRLALKIAGWLLLLYLLIFIPSFIIEEARLALTPGIVYIADDAPRSIYTIGPQHAVYGVRKLDNYPDQIFIIGGSTAAKAFRPLAIMQGLAGYKVHNLAIKGANVTEMDQVADIINSKVRVRNLHSAVFVLCGQYSTFLDNQREFRDSLTIIDREKLRFHLYRLDNGKIVPVLPMPAMSVALFLSQPFIWLYTVKFNITNEIQELQEDIAALSQQNTEQGPSSKLKFYKDYWQALFKNGSVDDDQFNQFNKLVDRLVTLKATVVYVDLPVPSYLRKNFYIYDDYRRHAKKIAHNPSVHYLDLSNWAPDNQFSDDIHPKPEFCDSWSARLVAYLNTVIGSHHPKS